MRSLPPIRNRLFCPGPTPVPAESSLAGLETTLYHRSSEFKAEVLQARKGLQPFFQSPEDPLILTSSGSGAMESAMVNLTGEGDPIIAINGGKFGERWTKLGQAYGCQVKEMRLTWGETVDLDALKTLIQETPGLKAVFVQANETSTGVAHPIQDIADLVHKESDALLVVDAVSALVAHHIPMTDWGIDCLLSGSQKGFGTPAGLAFIALSDRAWGRLSSRRRFYFDLDRERKGQESGTTAWTPATSLIRSLNVSLIKLNDIGVEACDQYHRTAAEACREASATWGLSLFSKSHHSQALTAVALPAEVDGVALLKHAKERYGAMFAGGQDQAKGKIVRIAHLGLFDMFDLLAGLTALEYTLKDFHVIEELGQGVAAAMTRLHQP
ncbi:pyridoxal-phosphate-dependent aminotransferase family protein [Pseudobacteriovorax antillogorgiicola]|uniref:Aspartate aminotransferase n=1 Tax=Pseudobacteriovorax antillogorgiicola TaxID=1513793 RepID=A0A1Y6B6Y7_9BACT|nr:alanine--glyoxylate aminotransferase family protein [Pseudobacteriovorax antillogorgiicola]TCS59418.1 aspartate aminotransferase-like enzyme [Pseudobacteriovorax antillogorgiicola]SME88471.1 aspartate aminotransferase [Pseudobacteriovorax antillogorgiicola]